MSARRRAKATGWRKVAAATWSSPIDPQIYGDIEVDARALLAFIEQARADTGTHVTVTHVVGKAIAQALAEHPELNVYLSRGRFVPHDSVEIFFVIAVAEGRDLSGVKVKDADRKSVAKIAEELSSRAARIRTGEDRPRGDVHPLGRVLHAGELTDLRNVEARCLADHRRGIAFETADD